MRERRKIKKYKYEKQRCKYGCDKRMEELYLELYIFFRMKMVTSEIAGTETNRQKKEKVRANELTLGDGNGSLCTN